MHSFVHNPAGPFAIRLQQLLEPNGLHVILQQFSQMIQSERNVSFDNQKVLIVLLKVVVKVRFITPRKTLLQAEWALLELLMKETKCDCICVCTWSNSSVTQRPWQQSSLYNLDAFLAFN